MVERSRQSGVVFVVLATMFICSFASAQTREQGPWWPHPIWEGKIRLVDPIG